MGPLLGTNNKQASSNLRMGVSRAYLWDNSKRRLATFKFYNKDLNGDVRNKDCDYGYKKIDGCFFLNTLSPRIYLFYFQNFF
jgi:hypothetical protein